MSMIAFLVLLAQGGVLTIPTPLEMPVNCRPGEDCFIQKHVDHQVGEGRRDYRCGRLTTEEHDGVDFRLRTFADLRRGVDVLAAADGKVLRVRDGEPDISARQRPVQAARMAGNGVVIDHGDGWETQYSHLQRNSLAVRVGQRVTAGQRLGRIGLSGSTEFPHLHFSVRHRGRIVDPFTATPAGVACSITNSSFGNGLWSRKASASLTYRPTAILVVGFHGGEPAAAAARNGDYDRAEIGRSDPMVLWTDAFGTRDGDVQVFTIIGPAGQVIHRAELRIARGALSWFGFSGKRPPPTGWAAGGYVGSYELIRNGRRVGREQASIQIR